MWLDYYRELLLNQECLLNPLQAGVPEPQLCFTWADRKRLMQAVWPATSCHQLQGFLAALRHLCMDRSGRSSLCKQEEEIVRIMH